MLWCFGPVLLDLGALLYSRSGQGPGRSFSRPPPSRVSRPSPLPMARLLAAARRFSPPTLAASAAGARGATRRAADRAGVACGREKGPKKERREEEEGGGEWIGGEGRCVVSFGSLEVAAIAGRRSGERGREMGGNSGEKATGKRQWGKRQREKGDGKRQPPKSSIPPAILSLSSSAQRRRLHPSLPSSHCLTVRLRARARPGRRLSAPLASTFSDRLAGASLNPRVPVRTTAIYPVSSSGDFATRTLSSRAALPRARPAPQVRRAGGRAAERRAASRRAQAHAARVSARKLCWRSWERFPIRACGEEGGGGSRNSSGQPADVGVGGEEGRRREKRGSEGEGRARHLGVCGLAFLYGRLL